MNYEETLQYLFAKLPMYSRVGAAAYKADLDNIRALCTFLGNPQDEYRTIHIAGTNGKGSCSHMLASVLQSAGYRVGLHTSPHLHDFRERIRVNGEMCDEAFVTSFTAHVQPAIEETDPSFFELSVAMAFEYFRIQRVDVAIIETGLGGRLDSTNIIKPVLSVITNIGWDHMNLLGDSLEKIAAEKAGIIKPGVPVVVGEVRPETLPVFREHASRMASPLHVASHEMEVMEWQWHGHRLHVHIAVKGQTDHRHYELDLAGIYQLKNVITVLAGLHELKSAGWNIEEKHIHDGLSNVRRQTGLHGRWDIISQKPLVVLDVAHNVDGLRQVLEQVEVTDHHSLHIITGMVNDKDSSKLLSLFPVNASYYFTQAHIPRAKPAVELQAEATSFGLHGEVFDDVNSGLRAALDKADPDDLVLVCGSIFLIAEVTELR